MGVMRSCTKTVVMAAIAMGGVIWASACVKSHEPPCSRQSDCSGGTICSGVGFCESECANQSDCLPGSFCAPGCGICIRNDLQGPATCFAQSRGLSDAEVFQACGALKDAGVTDASVSSGALPSCSGNGGTTGAAGAAGSAGNDGGGSGGGGDAG